MKALLLVAASVLTVAAGTAHAGETTRAVKSASLPAYLSANATITKGSISFTDGSSLDLSIDTLKHELRYVSGSQEKTMSAVETNQFLGAMDTLSKSCPVQLTFNASNEITNVHTTCTSIQKLMIIREAVNETDCHEKLERRALELASAALGVDGAIQISPTYAIADEVDGHLVGYTPFDNGAHSGVLASKFTEDCDEVVNSLALAATK